MSNFLNLVKVEFKKAIKNPSFRYGFPFFITLVAVATVIALDTFEKTNKYLYQELSALEESYFQNGLDSGIKESLEREINRVRIELKLPPAEFRAAELNEQLQQIQSLLEKTQNDNESKKNMLRQKELIQAELAGDYDRLQRLRLSAELEELTAALNRERLTPEEYEVHQNEKYGLELKLAAVGNENNAYKYMVKIALLLNTILFPFFFSIIAYDLIAGEHNSGTLRIFLTRPVTRLRQLAAKVTVLTGLLLLITIVVSILIFFLSGIITEFGSSSDQIIVGASYNKETGAISYQNAQLITLGSYVFSSAGLLLMSGVAVAAFTLLLSVIFPQDFFPLMIVMTVIIINSSSATITDIFPYYKFFPFIHLNALNYFAEEVPSPFSEMPVEFSLIVLSFYIILFTYLTAKIFNKRDILN